MMKRILSCGIALAFLCSVGFTAISMAEEDKGPAEITMTTTIDKAKKPKPALFTHAKHQEEEKKLECGACHHSQDADGKQVAYVEGQKIEKCESCHNSGAGITNEKLDTLKEAAHANCKTCHKEKDKELVKCKVCHPKKEGEAKKE